VDFGLSSEQIEIQGLARAFALKEMAPFAAKWDEECIFPSQTLKQAAQLGFGGIYCSEDWGGSGLGRLEATIIFEELSTACPSTAAYLSIHNMASWMIDHFGNDDQRRKWVPDLCSMEIMSSYCLTEPGAGSDAAALRTQARRDGSDYVINGSKAFISGGSVSDLYVCMIRTGDDATQGISCIAVEKEALGLSFGKQEKKMGWHSQPTSAVIFDNCRVPVANLIGNEGDGFKIAMMGLDGGRLNIGACSIGGARAAYESAKEHMKVRKQFGSPLASFQGLQFKLADMLTELEAARLLIRQSATKLDLGEEDAVAYCAMAKRFSTDIAFGVCNDALQIHGGYGYLQEYGVERILRDLRVHQILEGTNEIMRVIIARHALRDG
jgi:alkylation response protein AidB-like acyl-CoA dehydrogenase